jgi:hypothetical protein
MLPFSVILEDGVVSIFMMIKFGSVGWRGEFFFFNRHYNPSWVLACSTIVEHSQQEGFTECRCQRHVKPPT